MHRVDAAVRQKCEGAEHVAHDVDTLEVEGVHGHRVRMAARRATAEFEDATPRTSQFAELSRLVAQDWRTAVVFQPHACHRLNRAV